MTIFFFLLINGECNKDSAIQSHEDTSHFCLQLFMKLPSLSDTSENMSTSIKEQSKSVRNLDPQTKWAGTNILGNPTKLFHSNCQSDKTEYLDQLFSRNDAKECEVLHCQAFIVLGTALGVLKVTQLSLHL